MINQNLTLSELKKTETSGGAKIVDFTLYRDEKHSVIIDHVTKPDGTNATRMTVTKLGGKPDQFGATIIGDHFIEALYYGFTVGFPQMVDKYVEMAATAA